MSEPDNVLQSRIWLRYADEDLEAAEVVFRAAVTPRHVCFLAQQATEKAIKAILIYCQIDFPKTHDLEALARLAPPEWTAKISDMDLSTLSEWAVEARYPGNWPEVTQTDALTALTMAKEIVQTVLTELKRAGMQH